MNIDVLNIVKKYTNRTVLDIDNFNFGESCLYAVLGLNGSGKSTLLECIAGVIKFEEGVIKYDDKSIDKVKCEISMLLQKPYIFNMSTKENILKGLSFKTRHLKYDLDRCREYLKKWDMINLLDKNARTLSGGEKAKVALLRVYVLNTKVTLLDEPTASMDLESTLVAENLIQSMVQNGKTVIMVTHDLYQAKRIADYVIYMDRGRIIEYGNKKDFFSNPSNEKVKYLLNVDDKINKIN